MIIFIFIILNKKNNKDFNLKLKFHQKKKKK